MSSLTERFETDESADNSPPEFADHQLDVSDKLTADRLTAINNARSAVQTARRNSQLLVFEGELDDEQATLVYREALEAYLLEIKQYRDVDDTARAYWTGTENEQIGEVIANPPPLSDPRWQDDSSRTSNRSMSMDNPTKGDLTPVIVARIKGLNDILSTAKFLSYEFSVKDDPRHGPPTEYSATAPATLSRDLLDTAFEWATAYSYHIGLDLTLEEESGDLEFRYEDFIEGDEAENGGGPRIPRSDAS